MSDAWEESHLPTVRGPLQVSGAEGQLPSGWTCRRAGGGQGGEQGRQEGPDSELRGGRASSRGSQAPLHAPRPHRSPSPPAPGAKPRGTVPRLGEPHWSPAGRAGGRGLPSDPPHPHPRLRPGPRPLPTWPRRTGGARRRHLFLPRAPRSPAGAEPEQRGAPPEALRSAPDRPDCAPAAPPPGECEPRGPPGAAGETEAGQTGAWGRGGGVRVPGAASPPGAGALQARAPPGLAAPARRGHPSAHCPRVVGRGLAGPRPVRGWQIPFLALLHPDHESATVGKINFNFGSAAQVALQARAGLGPAWAVGSLAAWAVVGVHGPGVPTGRAWANRTASLFLLGGAGRPECGRPAGCSCPSPGRTSDRNLRRDTAVTCCASTSPPLPPGSIGRGLWRAGLRNLFSPGLQGGPSCEQCHSPALTKPTKSQRGQGGRDPALVRHAHGSWSWGVPFQPAPAPAPPQWDLSRTFAFSGPRFPHLPSKVWGQWLRHGPPPCSGEGRDPEQMPQPP